MLAVNVLKQFFKLLISLFFLQLLVACGGSSSDSGGGQDTATLKSLSISPFDITLFDSGTRQLELKAFYSDNSVEIITDKAQWASSDDAIVQVNTSGLLTAQSTGSVTITASYQGQQNSVNVVVSEAVVTDIEVQPQGIKLPVGTDKTLTVTGLYSDSTSHDINEGISWLSADTNVAEVSVDGVVTAKAPGIVEITVSVAGIDKIIEVEVTAASLLSISITPSELTLAMGEEKNITVLGQYSDGGEVDITSQVNLITANPGILTFSSEHTGRVIGVMSGNTTLLASLDGIQKQINVVVTAAVIKELQLSLTKTSIPLGTDVTLDVLACYTDGSIKNVTAFVDWNSSNQSVAGILNSGVLHSIMQGQVEITAVYAGYSASVSIQITDAVLTSIEIAPLLQSLPAGINQQFSATGVFSDQTVQDITDQVVWSSSNNAVLFLSNSAGYKGNASALSQGNVVVSAQKGVVKGELTLSVTNAVLTSINIQPDAVVIPAGVTEDFTAIGQYSDGSTRDITGEVDWTTSNSAVVDNIELHGPGFVGKSPGEANISVVLDGQIGFASMQVTDAVLTSISISSLQTELAKGVSLAFKLSGQYSDGSTKELTNDAEWQSSDTNIATVDTLKAKGTVYALSKGTSTITANFTGFNADIVITVTDAVISAIQISAITDQLTVGQRIQLSAEATFSDSSVQNITNQVVWYSSDAMVASVSNTDSVKGQLTALAAGTTDITAEFQQLSSAVLPVSIVFDPDAPVSVSTIATPNAILNNGSDATVISATLQPADVGGMIADGTEVDFIITENDVQSVVTKTTVSGVATHMLTSSQTGLIKVEASVKGTGIKSFAAVLSVSDFYDVIFKGGFIDPDFDGTTLFAGSRFGLLAQNISNRDFTIVSFFAVNNSVHLADSPLDGSGISEGILNGGESLWLIYELSTDIVPSGIVTGIQLYDPATASNFGYQINFGI